MKKAISIMLMVIMVLCTVSVPGMASAADPEGTIVITPQLVDSEATSGKAFNAGFTVDPATKVLYKTSATDPSGNNVLAMGEDYATSTAMYVPGITAENAGLYEVFVYNIANVPEDDHYNNLETNAKPNLSRSVTYEINTFPVSSDEYCKTSVDIDPKTVLNGQDGWVSLGRHYFGGYSKASLSFGTPLVNNSTVECVTVRKYFTNKDYLYLSQVKFVPVTDVAENDTGIERVYVCTRPESKTWAYSNYSNTRDTEFETDALLTYSHGSLNDVRVIAITSNPKATVTNGNSTRVGAGRILNYTVNNSTLTGAGQLTLYPAVTAADGTTKTHRLSLERETTENIITRTLDNATLSTGLTAAEGHNYWNNNGTDLYAGSGALADKVFVAKVALADTYGETVSYSTGITTPGWYNAYAYNAATKSAYPSWSIDREVLATVTHNGIVEDKKIAYGGAVRGEWMLIGKFYFSGDSSESIKLSKINTVANSKANFTNIKLVPAVETGTAAAFGAYDNVAGISVSANGETISLTGSVKGKSVYLPAGADTNAQIKITAGIQVKSLTVNGTAVDRNTGIANVAFAEGNADTPVEIKFTHRNSSVTYNFTIRRKADITFENGLTAQTNFIPIDADRKGDSIVTVDGKAKAVWAADMATGGNKAYRVMLYKPALIASGTAYNNSGDVSVKVIAADSTWEPSIDWTGEAAEWVNLGTYTFSDAEGQGVELTAGSKPMLLDTDGIAFIEEDSTLASAGIELDGKPYTLEQLDGKIIEVSGNGNWKFIPQEATNNFYVNNAVVVNGTLLDAGFNLGPNYYAVTLKNQNGEAVKSIEFIVNASGVEYAADDAVRSEGWTTVAAYAGQTGNVYTNAADTDTINFKVESNVKGNAKLFFYNHKAATSVSGSAAIYIGETKIGDITTGATDDDGWIEVGSYNFGGNETITIKDITGNILADGIKLEYTDTVYMKPVIIETSTGVKAISAVCGDSASLKGKLILAKYSGGNLDKIVMADGKMTEGGKRFDTEELTGAGEYKAFVFEDLTSLVPCVGHTPYTKTAAGAE